MADQQDDTSADDKTEKPSERRLEQSRREGNVAVGRDVAMAASLGAGVGVLTLAGSGLRETLVKLVAMSISSLDKGRPDQLLPLLWRPALLAGAVVVTAAVAAGVAIAVQTRGGFWLELAMPDPSRAFGGQRLTRLFKTEMLADLGAALVKNLALGWVMWVSLKDASLTLRHLLDAGPAAQLTALFAPLTKAAVKIMAVLVAIAGADLAIARYRFTKKMSMSREELRREFKEDEGDPHVRGKRRRRHRDLAKGRIKVEVPRADVLLVNPTHIAIALRYRAGEDRAPRVTAKGKGAMAESMRTLARDNQIPIVEDIPLARLLWKRVKVGRTVPADTYKAVAAVLAFVYRVLGRDRAGASASSEGPR